MLVTNIKSVHVAPLISTKTVVKYKDVENVNYVKNVAKCCKGSHPLKKSILQKSFTEGAGWSTRFHTSIFFKTHKWSFLCIDFLKMPIRGRPYIT